VRAHIQKENTILFPMADRVIRAEELESMHAAFEEHEEKVLGHGRHEELHQMLHEMNMKYK
jgi:hemerythrin-like domain-containing protein